MSKYKDMMKNGWHPEKPGSNLRGQVVSPPVLPPRPCHGRLANSCGLVSVVWHARPEQVEWK